MKQSINTLEEALIQEMETLYFAEKKMAIGLNRLETLIHSSRLHQLISNYILSAEHKCLKIDRIFSYLNHQPVSGNTSVIDELINETRSRIRFAQDTRFQDLLLVSCLQRINKYMMCAYNTALRYAQEMELDVPVELLTRMITSEQNVEIELKLIAEQGFNPIRNKEEYLA